MLSNIKHDVLCLRRSLTNRQAALGNGHLCMDTHPLATDLAHANTGPSATASPVIAAAQTEARAAALSRWESEAGTSQDIRTLDSTGNDSVAWPSAESAQLRMRVIALENLVIALMALAPEEKLDLAREMALHISPRTGYTPHPLTLRAAEQMRSLVDRSAHFRTAPAARSTLTSI